MMRHHFLCAAAAALVLLSSMAQAAAIAPGADGAAEALKRSPRHGELVDIEMPGSDGQKLRSWVVYPERKDKAGVVIVIHEIFGLTDWVKSVADQLAADGFIAIAPDFLSGMGPGGGGTESIGESVRQEIRKLSPDEVNKRIEAARAYGQKLPASNGKTATIGFCWGGAASFRYATHQPELDAAVVYYGSAPRSGEGGKDADVEGLKKIKAPVLGLYGQDDERVNATIDETKKIMDDAGKTYTTHIYDAAGHGFLRQQADRDGANRKASEQAWPTTVEFLKKHLE